MLTVALNWIYILLTVYIIGFGFINWIQKWLGKFEYGISCYFAIGFSVITVYSQIFSLFYKVGLIANVILVIICILILSIYHRQVYVPILNLYKRFAQRMDNQLFNRIRIIFSLFLILLFLFATTCGYFHYDSNLYHGQSIHWIEQYGVVKGLGNLHNRLAYNSAFFCTSALYSFSFMSTRSYHTIQGILALLMTFFATNMKFITERKLFVSDLCKVALLSYIAWVFSGFVAPASDFAVTFSVFYIIIQWTVLLENCEESPIPFGLLCVMSAVALTLKMSAGCILLLSFKPAIMLIKEKRYKEIVCFLALGLICVMPFLARNYYICGYLLYPLTEIDIFEADWKMPASVVEYDAKEIQVWGRGIYDVARYSDPVNAWIVPWFHGLNLFQKFIFALNICVITIIEPVYLGITLYRKNVMMLNHFLVMLTVTISYIFWFLSAPLFRYGYAFIVLLTAYGIGCMFEKSRYISVLIPVLAMIVLIYGVKTNYMWYNINDTYSFDFVLQQDYDHYLTNTFNIGEETIYYPIEGDQIGYEPFPATTRIVDNIELRGMDIREGFKVINY